MGTGKMRQVSGDAKLRGHAGDVVIGRSSVQYPAMGVALSRWGHKSPHHLKFYTLLAEIMLSHISLNTLTVLSTFYVL